MIESILEYIFVCFYKNFLKLFTIPFSDPLPTDSGFESIIYLAWYQSDFIWKIIYKFEHISWTLATSNSIFSKFTICTIQSSACCYAFSQVFLISLFAKVTVYQKNHNVKKMLMFLKLYFIPKKLQFIILCAESFRKNFTPTYLSQIVSWFQTICFLKVFYSRTMLFLICFIL